MVIKYKDIKKNIFNLNKDELNRLIEQHNRDTSRFLYDGYAVSHINKHSGSVFYTIILNKLHHNRIEVQ